MIGPDISFERLGPASPILPVIVAIPHAGRDYTAELLAAAALPARDLAALEDRLVDQLAADLPGLGFTTFIARRPRAWIDLNRHEREIDRQMISPGWPQMALMQSAKVRGGLGLIPRRVAGKGDIWRASLPMDEIQRRITDDHRPWHDAISNALGDARDRFGTAVLLDLHSMPPLMATAGRPAPHIVLGDRHGQSCGHRFTSAVQEVLAADRLPHSRNTPYAGGHTLDRHGKPGRDIHALQVEVDRSLYLAPDMRSLGPGFTTARSLVKRIALALLAAAQASRNALPEAAE